MRLNCITFASVLVAFRKIVLTSEWTQPLSLIEVACVHLKIMRIEMWSFVSLAISFYENLNGLRFDENFHFNRGK